MQACLLRGERPRLTRWWLEVSLPVQQFSKCLKRNGFFFTEISCQFGAKQAEALEFGEKGQGGVKEALRKLVSHLRDGSESACRMIFRTVCENTLGLEFRKSAMLLVKPLPPGRTRRSAPGLGAQGQQSHHFGVDDARRGPAGPVSPSGA